jgi:muramoyltetrapeptide carboxypeptidase
LLKLAGTEYFPNMQGCVLFLEACDITPQACDYSFEQLKQMGVFDKITGVIIGYIYGLQHSTEIKTQMEDILLKVTKEYNFPILKCSDFGHNCPNTVLPIGVNVRINTDDLSIELLEKSVR